MVIFIRYTLLTGSALPRATRLGQTDGGTDSRARFIFDILFLSRHLVSRMSDLSFFVRQVCPCVVADAIVLQCIACFLNS